MHFDPLRYLTSTVGLITTMNAGVLNVMSAEWTSFVARDPLHIAVAVQKTNFSHQALVHSQTFAVTLCDTRLAPVAEFCGSFSGEHLDKLGSSSIDLAGPVVTKVPHVAGGVLNAECIIHQVVDLPGYSLFVGEAVWVQVDDEAADRPLVKHGAMYELGARLGSGQICVAGRLVDGELLVGATLQGRSSDGPWDVRVFDGCGRTLVAEELPADGDLEAQFRLIGGQPRTALTIRVARSGCTAGTATIPPEASAQDTSPGRSSVKGGDLCA